MSQQGQDLVAVLPGFGLALFMYLIDVDLWQRKGICPRQGLLFYSGEALCSAACIWPKLGD